MTNDLVISVDNLWKQYRYGAASHTTLRRDLQSWWARVTKKSDPNLPIEKLSSVPVEDRFWALKNISFDVHRGEAIGILGNNGAGKSTLLKTLSRVTAPTKGRIRIKGRLAGILEVGTGFHPE